MALTDKQQRFVEEYLIDLNRTQAAIRAGYSEDTAESQGSRLMSMNVEVARAVKEALAARSERTQVDADWVLDRLTMEAQADLGDLYGDDGELLPVKKWPLIWRQGLVAGIESLEERDETGAVIGMTRKVKLSDRVKRIELIAKHIDVGAFEEKVKHSGTMGITVLQEDANL